MNIFYSRNHYNDYISSHNHIAVLIQGFSCLYVEYINSVTVSSSCLIKLTSATKKHSWIENASAMNDFNAALPMS